MATTKLQYGQHIELDITKVVFGGDGVGQWNEYEVFVPFVIEGERIEARVFRVKRKRAWADLVRVISPSPHRIEPRCKYFTQCAGCQYQHIAYEQQLDLKRRQICALLEEQGGIQNPPVEPVAASPRQFGYRNKIVLHGPETLGFWKSGGQKILPIQHCPIAHDQINVALASADSNAWAVAAQVTLRCNSEGKVWIYTDPIPGQPAQHQPQDTMPPGIPETILGKQLMVPYRSFFQVNHTVIELVLRFTRERFQRSGCTRVVDAYCGIGLFALMLADLAERCVGIESDEKAIACARENARQLGWANCEFFARPTEDLLFSILRQSEAEQTLLILDPPRSGCSEKVVETLRFEQPRTIIYISCAPPALARDLKALLSFGYKLERLAPFDMFPQTQHCEVMAELRRE